MKKKIAIFALGAVFGFTSLPVLAEVTTNTTKATATLSATCHISANNVSWGMLMLPLTTQTAQSNLNVLCNKGSLYTIDIAYGGIYGAGSTATGYSIAYSFTGTANGSPASQTYTVYNNAGTSIGTLGCGFGTYKGAVYYQNTTVANFYGATAAGWQPNTYNTCTSNNTAAGTYPTGWVGAYNTAGKQAIGGPGYAYGMITGGAYGDKIAYSIEVPGDSSKVWNAGVNSYSGTGTGSNESIPVKASLIPSKSNSNYPIPDLYMDTVTTIISF